MDEIVPHYAYHNLRAISIRQAEEMMELHFSALDNHLEGSYQFQMFTVYEICRLTSV